METFDIENHAKCMSSMANTQVDLLTKLVEYSACTANHTGELTHAIGKLVDVMTNAKKSICDNQDCIHGGISRNGDLLEGITNQLSTLVAAGGQDAILENMMDDLRPLDMSTMDQARFGHCELVGVVSMGQAEARARRYTREEADAMRLRKELSNAYDQLAQANDRCNEIAVERDELARMLADRQSKMTKLQDSLADSQREVRSLTGDIEGMTNTLANRDYTIKRQQKEIHDFEKFMETYAMRDWHQRFLAWKAKQPLLAGE